jgi:hypothetical protein
LTRDGAAKPLDVTAALTEFGAWSFSVRSGAPVFTPLTSAEAAKLQASMVAEFPAFPPRRPRKSRGAVQPNVAGFPQPMDFWDDAWDEIGDAAKTAWDGISHAATVTWDGIKVVVDLAIDGIHYVYEGIVDTLERAMDVVTFVLNAAGAVLGNAVGWLLSKLGFLFDWDALKEKRDELKATARRALVGAFAKCPDPNIGAQDFVNNLTAIQAQFDAWVTQFMSSPAAQKTMGDRTSESTSAALKIMSGPDSSYAQVTWLIDKVRDYLPNFTGGLGTPNIPGLSDAIANLVQALGSAGGGLSPSADDLATLFESWIEDQSLFTNSTFDPILQIFQRHVDQLFGAAGQATLAGGQALHLLWANPDAIVDWLDTPISIPFFSGFYQGLTGNSLSVLDVICLAAAVPASLFEDDAALAMAAGNEWRTAGIIFASVGCLMTGLASFASAAAGPNGSSATKVLSVMDLACSGLWMACIINADAPTWVYLAQIMLIPLAANCLLMVGIPSDSNIKVLTLFGTGMMALVAIGRLFFSKSNSLVIYGFVGVIQNVMDIVVQLRQSPVPLPAAAAIGTIQGTLSGFRTWIYYENPLDPPTQALPA